MKKRIMSLILTVLMVLSSISAFSLDAFAADALAFEYKPTVYFGGGGEYNIVWKTTAASIGYVTFVSGGKSYTFYDEENGVVRSDDKIHSVRVPQDKLDAAGSYEVNSAIVNSRKGYEFNLGIAVSVSSTFTGYHKQKEIKFGFLSDLHLNESKQNMITECKKHVNDYMGGVDVIVLNGDVAEPHDESSMNYLFQAGHDLSEGKLPVLFVKGNHECRGEYSQYLDKYFSFNTGTAYGAWDYGPISGITIDVGEDKEDSHDEYFGVNDMDHYFDEQEVWLENLGGYTEGSTYHIEVGHSPWLLDRYKRDEYNSIMKNYGTDLIIAGHTHSQKYYMSKYDIPTLEDGGHTNNKTIRTSVVTFSNGTYSIKAISETGGTVFTNTLQAPQRSASSSAAVQADEGVTEEVTPVDEVVAADSTVEVVPTAAGISVMDIKGAVNTNVKVTTKPVVFDCGLYYCVVWATNLSSAGYVEIISEEGKFSYMDSVLGKLRTDFIHSVKIPKSYLDTAKYYVRNRVVTNYGPYGKVRVSDPTTYGPYVNGAAVQFSGNRSTTDKKYSVIAIGNMPTSNLADVAKANNVKSAISGTPNLIVSMGDMVGSLDAQADFENYLQFMNIVSGGTVPVLLLRGENETSGAFAAYLNRYIRITTEEIVMGRLYNNTYYGKLTVVSLDTATDGKDNAAKYGGYAAFDALRQEQASWISNTIGNSFKSKYNLLFAHGDSLSDYNGVNLIAGIPKLATNLVVTAGTGKSSFQNRGSSYALATCGSISGDATYGLAITCQDDQIVVKQLADRGAQLGTVDVTKESAANDQPGTTTDPSNPSSGGNTSTGGNTSGGSSTPGGTSSTTTSGTITTTQGTTTTTTGNSTTTYQPGEYDGIDGDMYVRTVAEGWYNDYLSLGFSFNEVSSVTADGKITEGVFIEIVSDLVGIDHSMYKDSTTKADKASAWAESYGIYSGYLGGATVLTDSVITSVLSGLFAA